MNLIDKLAIYYLKSTRGYDEHYQDDYSQNNYTDMREAFKAGFKEARELAAKKIKESVNLSGIEDPGDAIINCSLQSKHDHDICMNLGEEEVE